MLWSNTMNVGYIVFYWVTLINCFGIVNHNYCENKNVYSFPASKDFWLWSILWQIYLGQNFAMFYNWEPIISVVTVFWTGWKFVNIWYFSVWIFFSFQTKMAKYPIQSHGALCMKRKSDRTVIIDKTSIKSNPCLQMNTEIDTSWNC